MSRNAGIALPRAKMRSEQTGEHVRERCGSNSARSIVEVVYP
jgi:hypothetical protein